MAGGTSAERGPVAQTRAATAPEGRPTAGIGWTFLSNHAHVLVCLAVDPHMRLRDVALRVGITERAVQKIVADLEEGGYLARHRDGRRNHYVLNADLPLRHPVESHRSIADLLRTILGDERWRSE